MNIQDFGHHELGLDGIELKKYIRYRTKNKYVGQTYRKLMSWFHGQTGAIDMKTGEFIYYYHDIERGLDFILKGKPTYFD
jgi:hypothetical protein